MNYGEISPRTAEYAARNFLGYCADAKAMKLMAEARKEAGEQGHSMTYVWFGGLESKSIRCLNCGNKLIWNSEKGTIEWSAQ